MLEVIPTARVEPIIRLETAVGRSVCPLKETKMPFTNHMSGVTYENTNPKSMRFFKVVLVLSKQSGCPVVTSND